MKNKVVILIFLLFSKYGFTQRYVEYNNLSEIAKKLMVAERYLEAIKVFEITNSNYGKLFKSNDLYYWAIAEAALKQTDKAYQLLKRACKISNDENNIYAFIQSDDTFNFLNDKELITLKKLGEERQFNYNLNLRDQFAKVDSIDTYLQSYLVDSVLVHEGDSAKQKPFYDKFMINHLAKNRFFADLILENGYPDFTEIGMPISHLLFHIDSANWNRINDKLIDALHYGKLSPFNYAYGYLRANNEDRYNALASIEIIMRKEPEIKVVLKEKGKMGLGL